MKRHAFDPVSFVFGIVFAFIAVFVLSGNTLADLYPLWVWTVPAMTVGLLVILYGIRRALGATERETPSAIEISEETEPD